jgi:hypothetical protein
MDWNTQPRTISISDAVHITAQVIPVTSEETFHLLQDDGEVGVTCDAPGNGLLGMTV